MRMKNLTVAYTFNKKQLKHIGISNLKVYVTCDNLFTCLLYTSFMYRDFQSRNVMIKDGEPWFIDFQGGRKGPFYYDVASFLWQAKAKYPDSLRQELLKEYIDALRKYQPIDEPYFYSQLRHFVLFRTLQVLGAYGFRGYFEKKPHFIQSVPFAIQNLDVYKRQLENIRSACSR